MAGRNRGDNIRWSQRRVGTLVNSASGGGGGTPGTGITNIVDNTPTNLDFTINLTNGTKTIIEKPTTGSVGPTGPASNIPGPTGLKGTTGPQGKEGVTGSKGDIGP